MAGPRTIWDAVKAPPVAPIGPPYRRDTLDLILNAWGETASQYVVEGDHEYSGIAIGEQSDDSDCLVYPQMLAGVANVLVPSVRAPVRGLVRGPLLIRPFAAVSAPTGVPSVALHLKLYPAGYEGPLPEIRPDNRHDASVNIEDVDSYPGTAQFRKCFRGRRNLAIMLSHNGSITASMLVQAGMVNATSGLLDLDTIAEETAIPGGSAGAYYQYDCIADWIYISLKAAADSGGTQLVSLHATFSDVL